MCDSDDGGITGQRVKKDALWKPLLRGFRIYLRKSLQTFLDINQIYEGSGDLSMRAQEACKKYIKSIGAPKEVQNDKLNYYGLTIALVPSSAANLNKCFTCIPKLQKEIPRLRPLFSKIFRENSIKLRISFFSHELIRYLWAQFTKDESEEIKAYILRLKNSKPYHGQFEVLLKDLMALSQRLNYQILKPEHLC